METATVTHMMVPTMCKETVQEASVLKNSTSLSDMERTY